MLTCLILFGQIEKLKELDIRVYESLRRVEKTAKSANSANAESAGFLIEKML
jgi:hypothetical protein